jgi:hypothetical protein
MPTPTPTPYDVPLGDGTGSYAFRLLPTDEFDDGESRVAVDLAAAGRAVIVSYTWTHPVDGSQAGTLLLGVPGEDGSVAAAWVDSWHQRTVVTLTGTRTAAGAEVAYEYAPGWTWEIEVVVERGALTLVMRNAVPGDENGPAARYEAMRGRWF